MEAKQLVKSKTINFNALYVAVIAVLGSYGVPLKPELVALGQMVLNIVMRMVTKGPLAEKGK